MTVEINEKGEEGKERGEGEGVEEEERKGKKKRGSRSHKLRQSTIVRSPVVVQRSERAVFLAEGRFIIRFFSRGKFFFYTASRVLEQ